MNDLQPLRRFVGALRALLEPRPTERALLPQARQYLGELIAQDQWLPDAFAQPGADSYRQYLLYREPAGRFSIVSFVWGPGQRTPIHDHGVWGLIGMLRGAELGTRFVRGEAGTPMQSAGEQLLQPGDIDCVSPRLGDIHEVRNALPDATSVSIHLYGADIGTVARHVYNPRTSEARRFVSGYSPHALGETAWNTLLSLD